MAKITIHFYSLANGKKGETKVEDFLVRNKEMGLIPLGGAYCVFARHAGRLDYFLSSDYSNYSSQSLDRAKSNINDFLINKDKSVLYRELTAGNLTVESDERTTFKYKGEVVTDIGKGINPYQYPAVMAEIINWLLVNTKN